ncbi:MAG TPA: hypothetical protein PLZ62_02985, partial [bacterium]|nr:hypothetical protein [bacterium]
AKDSTKYYYRIGAYQDGEVIAYSNTVKITYNEDDNSDTDLSATNTNNGIKLTWGEYTDEDIDGYKLLKSTSDSTPTYPDQSYKYISGSSSESYTDTNVDDGEDYYYRLGYYHDSSIISYSNIVHITYNEDENNGDFDLSATSTGSGVKLSWDESDENEMDSYKILKSTSDSTPTYPSQSYKSISNYDTTTYTDTSVDDGEDYYYRVAIYYDGSVNGYSNIVHITYDENNDDDENDVNLSAESTDDGIELTWDEYTDEDIDGYKLLKSTSDSTPTYPSQSYRYISGSSSESYTDTYVDDGEDYYYRLGFYKDSGVVGYSNIVHVTYDEGNVSEDITLSAESTEDGIQLSWDRYNDSNIDGYKILKTASDSTPTYPDNSYKYVTGYKNNDYLDINVDDGEDYYYRIAVYQDGDAISYSDIVHITYEEN